MKHWIATNILGLKVLKKKDMKDTERELKETLFVINKTINEWYTKYKNMTPSRSSANISYIRIDELKTKLHKNVTIVKDIIHNKNDTRKIVKR